MIQVNGNKTYAAAIGIVLTGVAGFLTGDMTLADSVLVILNGLGLGALRHGVARNGSTTG